MWKIKQSLFICLDTGVATFVKYGVTQEVKTLVPMTQDVTFKIGYFLVVQTLQN